MATATVSTKGQVVIPAKIRKKYDIHPGRAVQNFEYGKLTEGIVKDILTKSSTHPHGIKVRLTSGAVGRVKNILCLTVRNTLSKIAQCIE